MAPSLTSDNPVVTFLPVKPDAWSPGHGFRQLNVVTAFPLAPSACLTMGIVGNDFRTVSENEVAQLNEVVVRMSDRFVYARTASDKIVTMVEEFGGTSVPGKNAFIGTFPDEKRIEEGLRRIMGVKRRAAAGGGKA